MIKLSQTHAYGSATLVCCDEMLEVETFVFLHKIHLTQENMHEKGNSAYVLLPMHINNLVQETMRVGQVVTLF